MPSSKVRNAYCIAFVSLFVASSPHVAAGQTCFRTPVSLPGLSGPPIWTGAGVVRTELNEPRWAAAPQTSFDYNGSLGGEGILRVLVDAGNTELSVSYQAPTDLGTPTADDLAYFAFSVDGTTAARARGVTIALAPSGGPASNPVVVPAANLTQWEYDASLPAATRWSSTASTSPPWLKDAAAWTNDATAEWGINFKVVLADAGFGAAFPFSTSVPFKIMFALHKRDEAQPATAQGVNLWTPIPPGGVNAAGAVDPNVLVPGTLLILEPTLWATATAVNAGCVDGITISGSQIGTRNVDSMGNPVPNLINTTLNAKNVFFASPTFPATVTPTANTLEATFHIANWGSIAESSAPWTPVPGGTAVRNGVLTPSTATPPAPAANTFQFECVANTSTSTCDMPVPAEDHQCVYVALRSVGTGSAAVPITRAAAYRNMDFVPLSDHSGTAEISVKGLRALFGDDKTRDVYLYVKRRNMPEHQNEPLWLQSDKMAATRRFADAPPVHSPSPRRRVPVSANAQPQVEAMQMPLPNTGVADLDLNAHQALSAVWPTYDVHVYYDSGKTLPIGKTMTRQLVPMYPFTYFYSHEGPLYGFAHALEGIEGAEVKQLRPDVFHLRIASEGVAKLKISATAHEKPKTLIKCPECDVCTPPVKSTCNCSSVGSTQGRIGIGALIGGLILTLAWRRRRRSFRA